MLMDVPSRECMLAGSLDELKGRLVLHGAVREGLPIRSIIVPDQIPRRRVPRKCLHDLLR
jgi:hypothetical protein